MATVVKAPYNIIIYSLTVDDLTHEGQFWTLMSNMHTNYYVSFHILCLDLWRCNKISLGGVKFFSGIPPVARNFVSKKVG
jgi:hypothetical protein